MIICHLIIIYVDIKSLKHGSGHIYIALAVMPPLAQEPSPAVPPPQSSHQP